MYFYTNTIPIKNSLVVCHIVKESDSSFYVELPEYNNVQGIITKSQLPKKRKQYHKTLKYIRSTKTFTGIITDDIEYDDDGNTLLINISFVSDKELNEKYMNYYKRYQKLIKVLFFIAKETDDDYYNLLKKLKINPIDADDDIVDHYENFIQSPQKYISDIGIEYDMTKYITYPKINIKINLLLSIGSIDGSKLTDDPVFVLKNIFDIIVKSLNVKIIVVGCPNYQVLFDNIDIDNITEIMNNINKTIQDYIDENEIKSYVFDMDKPSDIKYDKSEPTITFPYKIEF